MSDNTKLVAEARRYPEARMLQRLADALEAAEAEAEDRGRRWHIAETERDEARRIAEQYRDASLPVLTPKSARPLPWESPSEGGN